MTFKRLVCLTFILAITCTANATITNFDDLTLGANSYSNDSGGFSSGSATFNNYSDTGYWDSWAYSNKPQSSTEKGMAGQYTAKENGAQSSPNYGIAYMGFYGNTPTMTLGAPGVIGSIYVTNNNYAYYAMLEGDAFSKKFGDTIVDGETGPVVINQDAEDWFMLTITGKNAAGAVIDTVDFYLADFRFADNNLDYIVDEWTEVDLSLLGIVASLEFALSSSDKGSFGMNTPAYFAMDTVVPEPTTIALFGLGSIMLRRRRG